jgi:hypothetical protein
MDIAVNLVESYLRLNGYLTLSEFEVQRRQPDGRFKTVTDVDVMGIRFPGAPQPGSAYAAAEGEMLMMDDPVLQLEAETIDVIIGEVKQGPADFNPALKDHGVLFSMLRRVEWLFSVGLNDVIEELQRHGVHSASARGGGTVRTRLVAFGRSDQSNLNTVSISHMIETLLDFFEKHEEAFRPSQFREPAPAFLRLLLKAGFDIRK